MVKQRFYKLKFRQHESWTRVHVTSLCEEEERKNKMLQALYCLFPSVSRNLDLAALPSTTTGYDCLRVNNLLCCTKLAYKKMHQHSNSKLSMAHAYLFLLCLCSISAVANVYICISLCLWVRICMGMMCLSTHVTTKYVIHIKVHSS